MSIKRTISNIGCDENRKNDGQNDAGYDSNS